MNNLAAEINWLLEEKYGGKLTEEAKKDVERLKKGEPVDYVIGFIKFLDCRIDLSFKPLIPRVETEYWVGEAIKEIKKNRKFLKNNLKILDIFAGSGCVGIAILKKIKNSEVDFSEKEPRFLEQIKKNLKLNKIKTARYRLIKSDIFRNIKGKYDYIFANPPYVASDGKHKVQKSVLKFEPLTAVFGGGDGLFYIKKFLKEIRKYLKKGGKFYLEFDSFQKKDIEKILEGSGFDYKFSKDQYGRWRYLTARIK